jgi:hypothetical protein
VKSFFLTYKCRASANKLQIKHDRCSRCFIKKSCHGVGTKQVRAVERKLAASSSNLRRVEVAVPRFERIPRILDGASQS